jgi:non-ribosomal peptide synthetase component F
MSMEQVQPDQQDEIAAACESDLRESLVMVEQWKRMRADGLISYGVTFADFIAIMQAGRRSVGDWSRNPTALSGDYRE